MPSLANEKSTDRGRANRSVWGRTYRKRIARGVERCRMADHELECSGPLTFDHVIPFSRGGRLKFNNTTILCETHNKHKGHQIVPGLISLEKEEAAAPPRMRWAAMAYAACCVEYRTKGVWQ